MLRERMEKVLKPGALPPKLPVPDGQDVGIILSQYLEGELTRTQCLQIEEHLAQSPDCRGACEALRRLLGECKSCQNEQPPQRVASGVRSAIKDFLSKQG